MYEVIPLFPSFFLFNHFSFVRIIVAFSFVRKYCCYCPDLGFAANDERDIDVVLPLDPIPD